MDLIDSVAMRTIEGLGSRSNILFMNSTVKKVIREKIKELEQEYDMHTYTWKGMQCLKNK